MQRPIAESAIIVIESPNSFVFEDRPNLPGVAYAGMIGLFGGQLQHDDKDALSGLKRELGEEITADPDSLAIRRLWQPMVRLVPLNGGMPRRVLVNTFLGSVADDGFEAKEDGHEIARFDKAVFRGNDRPDRMTGFAYAITRSVVLGRIPRLWH